MSHFMSLHKHVVELSNDFDDLRLWRRLLINIGFLIKVGYLIRAIDIRILGGVGLLIKVGLLIEVGLFINVVQNMLQYQTTKFCW
ncbi:hypothetical protein COL154_005509 [Colletotrichum chrysophilum]|nr:hypothetical protein KNSL1_000009 [Colletotrichum chrysophilum]KAJ0363649.1 hypothetical protein COL154_005509 [Colletotrichum chrysophilum]